MCATSKKTNGCLHRFTIMHQDRYTEFKYNDDLSVFVFISRGKYGDLIKVVNFGEIPGNVNVFNLSLGTLGPDGETDFISITNNGDRNKILVTVADIILKFMEMCPGKSVYITGSDSRRTLLYQRAIAYGYDELVENFEIYGETSTHLPGSEFEPFDKAKSYSGFLIQKIY